MIVAGRGGGGGGGDDDAASFVGFSRRYFFVRVRFVLLPCLALLFCFVLFYRIKKIKVFYDFACAVVWV